MLSLLLQRRTCASHCGTVSHGERERERSQHNSHAGRNLPVEHVRGRRPANRRERLHKRCRSKWLITSEACCEKSIQHSNPPLSPQPLHAGLTSLHAPLPGVFKCIIITILPAVSPHCHFCSVVWNSLCLNCCHSSSAATPTRANSCWTFLRRSFICKKKKKHTQAELINNIKAAWYDFIVL